LAATADSYEFGVVLIAVASYVGIPVGSYCAESKCHNGDSKLSPAVTESGLAYNSENSSELCYP